MALGSQGCKAILGGLHEVTMEEHVLPNLVVCTPKRGPVMKTFHDQGISAFPINGLGLEVRDHFRAHAYENKLKVWWTTGRRSHFDS